MICCNYIITLPESIHKYTHYIHVSLSQKKNNVYVICINLNTIYSRLQVTLIKSSILYHQYIGDVNLKIIPNQRWRYLQKRINKYGKTRFINVWAMHKSHLGKKTNWTILIVFPESLAEIKQHHLVIERENS